jgi:hypothetical protein
MNNELQKNQSGVHHELQIANEYAASTQIAQVGFKSTQVAHAENVVVNNSFNYIAPGGIPKLNDEIGRAHV